MPQNSYIPYVKDDSTTTPTGEVNQPQLGSKQVSLYLKGNGTINQFNLKAKVDGLTVFLRDSTTAACIFSV